MAYKLNRERAAAILVDAAYMGDEEAAKKWKVTVRTIFNYRERLKSDAILSELFHQKRAVAEVNWVSRLKKTMGAILDKATMIVECIEPVMVIETELGQQQEVNMVGLRTLIVAGKELGEIALAWEMIHADADEQDDAAAKAGPSISGRPALPN